MSETHASSVKWWFEPYQQGREEALPYLLYGNRYGSSQRSGGVATAAVEMPH